MRGFIVLGLVAFVLCQQPNWPFGNIFNFGTDRIHSFTFEYHRRENVLLVRNSTTCFICKVDQTIESDLQHRDSREKIEDALYMQIKADQGETPTTLQALRNSTHDNRALFECFRHDVYEIKYMST